MEFVWTEDLAVGVKVIDLQHQELFSRINSLVNGVEAGKGAEEVEELFKFLEDYIEAHFVSEEKAMAIYAYPEIKAHKEQHSIFVSAFNESRERFREHGADSSLVSEMQKSICDWLRDHVSKVDKELGAFLKDKVEPFDADN